MTAIATIILAIITAWYAYLTHRLLRAQERATDQEDQVAWDVAIQTSDQSHDVVYVSLWNIGRGVARDVSIKSSDAFADAVSKVVHLHDGPPTFQFATIGPGSKKEMFRGIFRDRSELGAESAIDRPFVVNAKTDSGKPVQQELRLRLGR